MTYTKKLNKEKMSKFSQKIFFQKIFLFQLEKCFQVISRRKIEKKFFLGQIGLEFIAYHDQTVCCTLSRVSPVERKSIFTIFTCFKRKIFKKDPFQILSWRPKMYIFVHAGINGLTLNQIFVFLKWKKITSGIRPMTATSAREQKSWVRLLE